MALIVYDVKTGQLRRVVFDKLRTDDQLRQVFPPLFDEAILLADFQFDGMESFDSEPIQNYVSKVTGLVPTGHN